MYCPNCTAPCEEGHHFCPHCGEDLTRAVPQSAGPKKKKRKLLLPAALALFFLSLCLAIYAVFPKPSHSGTPWFQLDHGTLCFYPERYTGGSELRIPAQIDGRSVKALDADCFADCDFLTTVILPDTLEAIGSRAFSGCASLRGIFIPESVTEIGEKAFYGCGALEAICVPSTVQAIGSRTFDSCPKLAHIFFPGRYEHWIALYSEEISPNTMVYCTDGPYLHIPMP